MKLNKKHKTWLQVAAGVGLVGASAGIVFGISAATFNISFVDLTTLKYLNLDGKYIDLRNGTSFEQSDARAKNLLRYDQWTPLKSSISIGNAGDEIDNAYLTEFKNRSESSSLGGTVVSPIAKITQIDNIVGDPYELDKMFGAQISQLALANRFKYTCSILDGANHQVLDKSFNESVFDGVAGFVNNRSVRPLTQTSASWFKPTTDTNDGYKSIMNTAINSGYKVLNTPGFNFSNALNQMINTDSNGNPVLINNWPTTNGNFGNAGYIFIDGTTSYNPNVASVMFRSDECAIFSGLSACIYLMNNINEYYSPANKLSFGVTGGTALQTVLIYMGGLQKSLFIFNNFILKALCDDAYEAYINIPVGTNPSMVGQLEFDFFDGFVKNLQNEGIVSKVDIVNKLHDALSVEFIDLGQPQSFFSGSYNSGDARGLAKQLLNRGANVLCAVAGPQTLDFVQEIQNQGSNSIVIGVDTAMENSDYQRTSRYTDNRNSNGIIKFSAVKDMGNITRQIIDLGARGLPFDGADLVTTLSDPSVYENKICGYGFTSCANSFNGGTNVSNEGWTYLLNSLKYLNNGIETFETFYENSRSAYLYLDLFDFTTLADIDWNDPSFTQDYSAFFTELSQMLNEFKLDFNFDGIIPNESSNIKSIFEWLAAKMYFIS